MRILSNHSFPGDDAFDLMSFSGTFHDRAYYDSQKPCFFTDILAKMPAGWEPDFVLFKSPLYFAVPYGIEDSPYPTVLLLDDWFGGADYLPDTFAKFDYIFTDKTSVSMLRRLGFDNAGYGPLFAFDPSLFRLLPGVQRTYDVSFAGSVNVNVQGRRLPWLRRLAGIDKRYNVGIFHQAWQEEYVKLLNQSKIVFNRSIKGEMNQRAFEAAACGAMLFMEEENLEVRDFFVPGKECVLFNNDNFEELLDHYLTHDDERAEIAKKGYEKAQAYSMPVLFGTLMDKIQGMRLSAGQGRGHRQLYASIPEHRDFVQASLAKSGRGDSTVKNVSILISRPSVDGLVLNDCAVVLMSYADELTMLGDPFDRDKIVAQTLSLLTHAESRTPGFLTPVFNRAQMLLACGKTTDAADIFRRLFSSAAPASYELCKGLAYPLHYGYPLRYEWSMALTAALPDSAAMARNRHTLIRFFSAANLGTIALEREVPLDDEAIFWFEEAHSLVADNPHVVVPLARLFMKKKHARAHDLGKTALVVNPFHIDFWKEWALYLSDTNCIDEARSFIESCLLCLSRIQLATKEMIAEFEEMRNSLNEKKRAP
jgi:hypothetical protein